MKRAHAMCHEQFDWHGWCARFLCIMSRPLLNVIILLHIHFTYNARTDTHTRALNACKHLCTKEVHRSRANNLFPLHFDLRSAAVRLWQAARYFGLKVSCSARRSLDYCFRCKCSIHLNASARHTNHFVRTHIFGFLWDFVENPAKHRTQALVMVQSCWATWK